MHSGNPVAQIPWFGWTLLQCFFRQPIAWISCVLVIVILIALVVLNTPQAPNFIRRQRQKSYQSTNLLDNISNSTFGFEKVSVVGLPARTDRRDGMTMQASTSDLNIDFIDGIHGDAVPDNAIPTSTGHDRLGPASIGSWRAHMNAIQKIVRENISSVLILEDDVDWDVRIKHQLRRFAFSTQALTQPLVGFPGVYIDPTYPLPPEGSPDTVEDIPFNKLPQTLAPSFSPYGDSWDLLWLGHCGMQFPYPDNKGISKGRVTHTNDDTVAEKRYLWSFVNPFRLKEEYPEHTRVVHHAQEGVCTLGYAITQQGARRLLQEVALKDVSDAYDILLRFFCDGLQGRRKHRCLTTQPGLFHHHRPVGPDSAQSDIGNHGEGFRDQAMTDAVRWSTRMNADVLIDGGNVFYDGFPDGD